MRMIGLVIAVLAAGPALANDEPINPDITLKNLDRAFELAAAELDTATVIYENECFAGPPASCSFHGQGTLEIRGIAATLDSPPSNLSLIYTPDGDPTPFALNVGLLVSICEPQMRQEDRGKIIASIIKIAGGRQKGPIVEGDNADYSVINIGGPIMVVSEKVSD